MTNTNMETIQQYLDAKAQASELENKAKKAMGVQFSELLKQAADLYREYKTTFGEKLPLPADVAAFKVGEKTTRKKRTASPATETTAPPTNGNGRKIGGFKRSLASCQAKLATETDPAKIKDLQDKIYELTDALTQLGVDIEESGLEVSVAVAGDTGNAVDNELLETAEPTEGEDNLLDEL